jgi:hypothetical protein
MVHKSVIRSTFLRWSVIVAALILIFAGSVKWRSTLMPEDVSIPTPVAPTPNARDYYNAAEAMIVDDAAVESALSNEHIDAGMKSAAGMSSWIPTNRLLTLPEKDRLAAENQPAIARLHEGMKYSYLAPVGSLMGQVAVEERGLDFSFVAPVRRPSAAGFPNFFRDQLMARLLAFEGRTRAAHGDWDGSADYYIEAMKLGGDITHESALDAYAVGITCQDIVRKYCSETVAHLSAAKARQTAGRLEAIDVGMEAPDAMIQEEKWLMQAWLLDLFRQKDWRQSIIFNASAMDESDTAPSAHVRLLHQYLLGVESPREAYDVFSQYMDHVASTARLPWPLQRTARRPAAPPDIVNKFLVNDAVFKQTVFESIASLALA